MLFSFSKLMALGLLLCAATAPAQAQENLAVATEPPQPPNIIFILTDDLGYDQIGAYGSRQIRTPNLDQMAKRGIRFTAAYAGNTVCSPSRVSLLTGRDSRLMKNNSNTAQLEAIDVTFAHVLKRGGYETALFGKYSLGTEFGVNDPLAMGFDTWFGMNHILEGHRQYPSFLWRDGKKVRIRENEGGKKGAYAQQLFTDAAIKFIQQNKARPFFVLLAYSSPHAELGVPKVYSDPYQNAFSETPYLGMTNGKPSDKYAWYYPEVVKKPKATFAGMVSALDAYVGKIVETLEQEGIDQNTLIVFTSDNGPHDEGGADPQFFQTPSPLRGIKRDLYEGGIRVPMIVSWPASIKTGRVDETPIVFADFLPTMAQLSDVSLDTIPRVKTNGVSLVPRLNDSPVELPERILYWEFGKQAGDPNSGIVGEVFRAARKGKWKVVQPGSHAPIELFDLEVDPGETKVLNQDYPGVLQTFEPMFLPPADASPPLSSQQSLPKTKLVRPPAGRLAIVVDGNSPDPDDIGGTAVMLGILHAASMTDRLVHLSHSCDLKPAPKISQLDEKRRQRKLQNVCDEGLQLFGPFQTFGVVLIVARTKRTRSRILKRKSTCQANKIPSGLSKRGNRT